MNGKCMVYTRQRVHGMKRIDVTFRVGSCKSECSCAAVEFYLNTKGNAGSKIDRYQNAAKDPDKIGVLKPLLERATLNVGLASLPSPRSSKVGKR